VVTASVERSPEIWISRFLHDGEVETWLLGKRAEFGAGLKAGDLA
jgi:hypothetical protein